MALQIQIGTRGTGKMSSSSRSAARKPQRRFQFIDNSNIGATSAHSTQVRRHVMQEYMREKRWETRTRAEGEILDLSTQPQVCADHPPSPPRKPPLKARSIQSVSTTPPVPTNTRIGELSTGSTVFRPCAYNFTPPVSNPSPTVQAPKKYLDQNSEPCVPTAPKKLKQKQQKFYLTPQSFASIVDLSDVAPLTPVSLIASGESLSSSPCITPFENSNHRGSKFKPEPVSLLSAARTDPFDCLPMTLNKQDQELFDFYATVMPACSYGFERRNPRAHNWYLSVFIPEAMKSSVAFQNTILVHAANTQAWVRGLSETPLAMEHRARASEMLLNHFQKYPYDTSDAAISSTLSAAALEDFDPRIERRKYAWLHWNAAVQKIRDRGGPNALEQNRSLRMLINWSDYIFSGYNGNGPTFFFDHKYPSQRLHDIDARDIARVELIQQCEEFVIFLKCAESLALVAANMQSNPTTRKSQPLRYSVFEPRQPLYNLIASPNGPRYTKTGQFKQIVSRLAALMTINVAVWEYRYCPKASEDFFRELVQNIIYNDLDLHLSVEALLQILLSGSENPSLVHTERPWLVGRLLKVAKRLSRRSWERLNEFLLQCLTLDAPLRPTLMEWENDLRTEILSAPTVSFVLPFLQTS